MFQMKKIQKNAVFSLLWREDREMARKPWSCRLYQREPKTCAEQTFVVYQHLITATHA